MTDLDRLRQVYQQAECLHSREDIMQGIAQMGAEISNDLQNENPIVMGVMNGGLVFVGHLLPELSMPLQVDYLHATRYGNEETGRELTWHAKPRLDLQDRTVLLVDDIFDEGVTLDKVVHYCQDAGAKSVKVAVLLDKEHDRKKTTLVPDYTCKKVPDRFVFGFGLDAKSYWRNAPGIFAVID